MFSPNAFLTFDNRLELIIWVEYLDPDLLMIEKSFLGSPVF